MSTLNARITIAENGTATFAERLPLKPGDYDVSVALHRSPGTEQPNVAPDPQDPWDKWPERLSLE